MKCRWIQFVINRSLDDERPLPPAVERHLESCAHCREFKERQSQAISRMRDTRSGQMQADPSPFLRARILNQIRAEQPATVRNGFGRWAWGGLAVAIVATAIVTASFLKPAHPVSVANLQPAKNQQEFVPAVLLERTTSLTSGGNLLRAATNIDRPLHKELNLVINDAQNALRSLRYEFVPSQLLAKGD